MKGVASLGFWFDESISALVAQRISGGWSDTFLSGIHYGRGLFYHYILSLFTGSFENIYFASRLANVVFFIPTSIVVYLWTKRIRGEYAATIATSIFCLAPFNIAMFREARFYEFLSLLVILIGFFSYILIEKIIKQNKGKILISKIKIDLETILLFAMIVVLGILALQTNEIVAYLIYFPIVFGLYMLVIFREKFGIYLILSFFSLLIAALLIKYGLDFKYIYIFKQPQIPWKALTSAESFSAFFHYFLSIADPYFRIIIPIGFLWITTRLKDWKAQYVFLFVICIYSIISIQGYGLAGLRYYYFLMPFVAIIIGLSLWNLFLFSNNKIVRIFSSLLIIMILSGYFIAGIKESNAVVNSDSVVDIKNVQLNDSFAYLLSRPDIQTSTIISDLHSSVPFYIYSSRIPDFLIAEDPKIEPNIVRNGKDIYLGMKTINFTDIASISDQNTYVINWYSPSLTPKNMQEFLQNNGELIYKHGPERIYLIRK
jgi:hypothetical protein